VALTAVDYCAAALSGEAISLSPWVERPSGLLKITRQATMRIDRRKANDVFDETWTGVDQSPEIARAEQNPRQPCVTSCHSRRTVARVRGATTPASRLGEAPTWSLRQSAGPRDAWVGKESRPRAVRGRVTRPTVAEAAGERGRRTRKTRRRADRAGQASRHSARITAAPVVPPQT
jgi:hypothetical protein